jgi:hypothetical protein
VFPIRGTSLLFTLYRLSALLGMRPRTPRPVSEIECKFRFRWPMFDIDRYVISVYYLLETQNVDLGSFFTVCIWSMSVWTRGERAGRYMVSKHYVWFENPIWGFQTLPGRCKARALLCRSLYSKRGRGECEMRCVTNGSIGYFFSFSNISPDHRNKGSSRVVHYACHFTPRQRTQYERPCAEHASARASFANLHVKYKSNLQFDIDKGFRLRISSSLFTLDRL